MNHAQLYAIYDSDPRPVVEFLRRLLEDSRAPAPSSALRVLDVGCGPGRLLAPLAGLGWQVTGLEPDPDYARAAEREASTLEGVEVRRGGFGDIAAEAEYDLVAAVKGPFSYLLSHEARRDAMARCARALRPRGLLFLHFSNFWWILKHYREPPEKTVTVDGIPVTRTAHHEIDYHAGRFTHVDTFRWTSPDGSERVLRKTHEMAMVDPPETERLLRAVGLEDIRTFNAYEDRAPSRLTGKRVMISARKAP